MLYLLSTEHHKYVIADYEHSKLTFSATSEFIITICRRTKAEGILFISRGPERLEYVLRYIDAGKGPIPVTDDMAACVSRYIFVNIQSRIRNIVQLWLWNNFQRVEVPKDDNLHFQVWESVPEWNAPVQDTTNLCEQLPETMEEWMELWFDVFNKEYFDGKLPVPEFTARDYCGGALGEYDTGKRRILLEYYEKNPFLFGKTTREYYQVTLIHEMIHEYQHVNGLKGVHGKSFMDKAAEIDKKGGWRIVGRQLSRQYLPRWTQPYEQYWWITRQNSYPEYIVYQSDVNGTIPKEMENARGRIFVGNGVLYKVNTFYRAALWGKCEFKKAVLPILNESVRLSERDPLYPELP